MCINIHEIGKDKCASDKQSPENVKTSHLLIIPESKGKCSLTNSHQKSQNQSLAVVDEGKDKSTTDKQSPQDSQITYQFIVDEREDKGDTDKQTSHKNKTNDQLMFDKGEEPTGK